MLQAKRLTYIAFFICCLCALGGCGGKWHPVKFATVEEAFPSANPLESTDRIPSDSIKKSLFHAPYEDVYRAVSMSVSQALMHVEKEDKKNGVILAVRTIQVPPPRGLPTCWDGANLAPQQRNYYYAIVVVEKGPKSTEVTAIAKAQGRCIDGPCLDFLDRGESTLSCHAYASVHWATAHESSLQELIQLMTLIRNNLIAAGLL